MAEHITAARYGSRAYEFVRAAAKICDPLTPGDLASAGLLLGFACELLAKRRLLHHGVPEAELRNKPYGHDILAMWKDHTSLFEEAEQIVDELKKNPNPNGVDSHFAWSLHFEHLALGHSAAGDYSLRYHQGEIHFSNPKAICVVLNQICSSEQQKSNNWAAHEGA